MSKLSKETIDKILEDIYSGVITETMEEEKVKNKPKELSYEEELLLKHSLPVAYLLYLLRALGYAFLAFLTMAFVVCIGMFWYGYIPHSINMFLFERFPEIFVAGLDLDYYFDNGILILVMSWAIKDGLLYLLYLELTTNLDRVNKIKEESKELFDD